MLCPTLCKTPIPRYRNQVDDAVPFGAHGDCAPGNTINLVSIHVSIKVRVGLGRELPPEGSGSLPRLPALLPMTLKFGSQHGEVENPSALCALLDRLDLFSDGFGGQRGGTMAIKQGQIFGGPHH